MVRYRYEAQNDRGERVRGEVEAGHAAEAENVLRQQGLEPVHLVASDEDAGGAKARLSGWEAEQVLEQVAALSTAQLPLADGLRAAAAEESTSRRMAAALRSIARDLDTGMPIEEVLQRRGKSLPAHVRGLVMAAAKSGRLGPALDELVEHQRLMREVAWGVVGAVAYPLIVLVLTVAMLSFVPLLVVPEFKQMFEEFELELPTSTELLIVTSDIWVWMVTRTGVWFALGFILLAALLLFGGPGLAGAVYRRRLLTSVPIVGVLWYWSGAAAFARMLAVFVDHGLPLPQALRLTADGMRDANVRDLCQYLSEGVDQGSTLADLLEVTGRLPASLTPLVRWGEKTGELADALRSASELFIGRIRLRAMLLRSISPPLVFIMVFLAVGATVIALFLPLISLIQGLS